MSSNVTNSERRVEIARRTREGLDEDFQDMGVELADDLEGFERRIRRAAARAPDWISVDPSGVVDLFKVEDDELPEAGFLGPRMVAIAAGVSEEFVGKWLPSEPDEEPMEFDDQTREEFERDLREVFAFLDDIERRTRLQAERAHVVLEEWMETNLAYLDELRENDIEALKELVGEGALETGPDARAERAQLWDEQRKRADELAEIWDVLHALVDEGFEETRDGLEEVEALVGRACQGLAGSAPDLEESGIVREVMQGRAEGTSSAGASGESSGSRDSRSRAPAESELSEGSGAKEVDGDDGDESQPESASASAGRGAYSETEPLGLEGEAPEANREGSAESGSEDGARDEDFEAGAEKGEEPTEEGGPAPGPTAPMITSPGEDTGEDDDEQADTSDASREEESGDSEDESERDEEVDRDDSDGVVENVSEDEPEQGFDEDERGDSEPVGTDEESVGPRETARREPDVQPYSGRCLRIHADWRVVETAAILAALGPPVGFLVAIVGVGIAHFVGLESAVNPVASWNWVEPAVGVALAWCLLAPLLLGWRPRWTGWSFTFVHRTDVREEVSLELDGEGLTIGKVSIRWDAVGAFDRKRWMTADEEMAGWLFEIDADYSAPIKLIAPAGDRDEWEHSAAPLVDAPTDAWQVEPVVLERLRAYFRGRSTPHR